MVDNAAAQYYEDHHSIALVLRLLLTCKGMSSSLLDIWEASANRPFYPSVSQNSQFVVGATLLISGKTLVCSLVCSNIP